jgi:hypothetical protein
MSSSLAEASHGVHIDALAYVDPEIPGGKEAAIKLVEQELRVGEKRNWLADRPAPVVQFSVSGMGDCDVQSFSHPRFTPPIFAPLQSPILQAEWERTCAEKDSEPVDLSRYTLDPPTKNTLRAWTEAVDAAQIQIEHTRLR